MPAYSAMDLESGRPKGPVGLHGVSAQEVRLGFVRKVYGIVASQLCFTALVGLFCTWGPVQKSLMMFVMHHPGLYKWGSLIGMMLSLFLLMACKKEHPLNLFVLCIFTTIMAFNVGMICSMVAAAGLGSIVAEAAVITAALFAGLTLYAFTTKRDLSVMGAILFPCLCALTAYGFLSMFFPGMQMGAMGLVYSIGGAVLFCGYIVFDTFRIQHQLSPDDYIEGAIQLYLDIVNLFLHILDILLKMSKKD